VTCKESSHSWKSVICEGGRDREGGKEEKDEGEIKEG
jgi:hypothetical protein